MKRAKTRWKLAKYKEGRFFKSASPSTWLCRRQCRREKNDQKAKKRNSSFYTGMNTAVLVPVLTPVFLIHYKYPLLVLFQDIRYYSYLFLEPQESKGAKLKRRIIRASLEFTNNKKGFNLSIMNHLYFSRSFVFIANSMEEQSCIPFVL